jgi:mRNA interferase MazF
MLRGEIWLVNLGEGKGSIQSKMRPCVLISNNMANRHSPVLHICPITSASTKSKLPTHIGITKDKSGLLRDSIALCEQVMLVTKDKDTFIKQVGFCDSETMDRINQGIIIQFSIAPQNDKNVVYA